MRRNISQHAVWIPGNDNYQPQLCTALQEARSDSTSPLDVTQIHQMIPIWQEKMKSRMKWMNVVRALGWHYTQFHFSCLWCDVQMERWTQRYVADTWWFNHFNRCCFRSIPHTSHSVPTISKFLWDASLNEISCSVLIQNNIWNLQKKIEKGNL